MDALNELEVILRDNTTVTGTDAMKEFIKCEVANVIEHADTGDVTVDLSTPSGIQGAAELIFYHIEAATEVNIDIAFIVDEICSQLKRRK